MTSNTMDWLNQNRHRSFPLIRSEWREKVSPESGLDCILLDAVLLDSDASAVRSLMLSSIAISRSATKVSLKYGDEQLEFTLIEGETSGAGSFEVFKCAIRGAGARTATLSLAFSSHAYIKERVSDGIWDIGCNVLPSRVLRLTDGFGVDGIVSNGSKCVDGHDAAAEAYGDVVLEDGYRTSPIIRNGQILVRVGKRYGYNPCKHRCEGDSSLDCRKPLFFFCGQNAVNGGNVILKGGKGISVVQGRSYTVHPDDTTSKCAGKTIPCIEIIAGSELMDLYKPLPEPPSEG